MTTLALEFSPRVLTILSNSPGLGSRGILTVCDIHTFPGKCKEKNKIKNDFLVI